MASSSNNSSSAGVYHIDFYSGGYVVEWLDGGRNRCESWLLLPAENLWPIWLRAILYTAAMLYVFVGIAISSDIFMSSIEFITSTKKTVTFYDDEIGEQVTKEVYVWNETVANLTLMALGSSAPEILLAVIETVSNLSQIDSGKKGSSLGLFTIIGSAAFNLLIITGICIISVPSPEFKRIKEFGVFCMTSAWSVWAYVWMLLCAAVITPHVIDLWEALVTFAFFPVLVLLAYCQDSGWWLHKCRKTSSVSTVTPTSQTNVRILSSQHKGHMGPSGREMHDKPSRMSITSCSCDSLSPEFALQRCSSDRWQQQQHPHSISVNAASSSYSLRGIQTSNLQMRRVLMRAKFRHAAIKMLVGAKKRPKSSRAVHFQDRHLPLVTSMENLGRVVFSCPSYSVMESAGHIDIDVIYYRTIPLPDSVSGHRPLSAASRSQNAASNEQQQLQEQETMQLAPAHSELVTVEFETREGTARDGHDYSHTCGSLTFGQGEYVKTIRIPITDDVQYEADKDFYVILKSAANAASVMGDPSVARVTIIDDDEPGVFSFAMACFHGDPKSGMCSVAIRRSGGSDGVVTLDLTTANGTAVGGPECKTFDYVETCEQVTFKHGEMQKIVEIPVNSNSEATRNFLVTLKNPSLGARIGDHGGAVCFIGKASSELDDRLAIMVSEQQQEEEEEPGYKGQILQAMTIETEEDENGQSKEVSGFDMVMHFCTFFFKVFCSLIPPRKYMGAYPTFVVSLIVIGLFTALVEQLGSLLGCVVNLKEAVTGITIVAIGTSLPDTFASRTAALQDEHADNSIGNVTGSNSVNVFLGLGLPWTIASIYALAKGKDYCVDPDNLVQSLIFFLTCATVALIILFARRAIGGELGGKFPLKIVSGITMISLWVIYIVLASLKAYDILKFEVNLPDSVCNVPR